MARYNVSAVNGTHLGIVQADSVYEIPEIVAVTRGYQGHLLIEPITTTVRTPRVRPPVDWTARYRNLYGH